MVTITLLAFIQAFFLATLLFGKKNKHYSDLVLGTWLLFIGIHTFIYYIVGQFQYFNSLILNLNSAFPLLQGPFLFLYVNSLTQERKPFFKTYSIHFIPFLIYASYQIFVYLNNLNAQNVKTLSIHIFEQSNFLNSILIGSVPLYVIWCLFILKSYKSKLLNNFSSIDKINLDWLNRIILGLALVWFVVIITFFETSYAGHLIFISVTLFVYAIGYFGFKQTTIFSDMLPVLDTSIKTVPKLSSIESSKSPKYQKSQLSESQTKETVEQLELYMKEKKPYLNDQLTLPMVADDLNMTINHLSQVINSHFRLHFYDFINQYRVENVKKNLSKPEFANYSLMAIAFDSGFGSKSAFNRIFKKTTGKTPSQFLNEQKKTL